MPPVTIARLEPAMIAITRMRFGAWILIAGNLEFISNTLRSAKPHLDVQQPLLSGYPTTGSSQRAFGMGAGNVR